MTHARRLWAIPVLAVVVAALLLSDRVHEALLGVLATAQRLAEGHGVLAAALVVLFAALAAMLAFVSSGVIVPFAVYTWGTLPALVLLWAGWLVGGATAYVNLEPCAHHGRTPPCAERLVGAGVRRVVAAIVDPNPLVNGRGFELLRAAGIYSRLWNRQSGGFLQTEEVSVA